MEKALSRLDKFCKENEIDYVITGTLALELLGISANAEPGDIDILYYSGPDKMADSVFKMQEELACLEKANYPDCSTFTFKVNDVKVNVIKARNYEELLKGETVFMKVPYCGRPIFVHKALCVLNAKAKLHRQKDYDYMLRLINILTGMSL